MAFAFFSINIPSFELLILYFYYFFHPRPVFMICLFLKVQACKHLPPMKTCMIHPVNPSLLEIMANAWPLSFICHQQYKTAQDIFNFLNRICCQNICNRLENKGLILCFLTDKYMAWISYPWLHNY